MTIFIGSRVLLTKLTTDENFVSIDSYVTREEIKMKEGELPMSPFIC